MTLNPNQFALEVIQGALDLAYNPNTISCKVSANETETLVPGSPVKIEDSVGGVPNVLLGTADTDNLFGFVVRNLKKSSFVASDSVEIAIVNNVMQMTAGAAIARGAMVECDVSEAKVITSAGVNPICGFALDKAAADTDIIRIYILTPRNITFLKAASAAIGDLGVSGDLDVSGKTVKGVNNYSSGAGALPIDKDIIALTTGGAEALTLADGVEGQELEIIMVSDGGDGTVTPSNYANGTTLTFDNNDSAKLRFVNSAWHNVGTPTAAVA